MNKKEIIDRYLFLLENFETDPDSFLKILHEDFLQTEFPNLLNPKGQESHRQSILDRIVIGKKMLSSQKYEMSHYYETTDTAIIECSWQGVAAVDAGPIKKNQCIQAKFCFICEFKDGKLFRQRNYDCFLPFT